MRQGSQHISAPGGSSTGSNTTPNPTPRSFSTAIGKPTWGPIFWRFRRPDTRPDIAFCFFENRFLFTGDHLAWNRTARRLEAFRDYCWHSWEEQTESMRRLAEYRFEWVLPGHGQSVNLPADEMSRQMRDLVLQMHTA